MQVASNQQEEIVQITEGWEPLYGTKTVWIDGVEVHQIQIAADFNTITGREVTLILMDEILDTSEDAIPPSFTVEIGAPQPFDYPEDDESRERKARAKLVEYKRGMRDLLYGTTSGQDSD